MTCSLIEFTDMFYPWTVDAAAKLGIPRLIYVGGGYLAHSSQNTIEQFLPHTKVLLDYMTSKRIFSYSILFHI